MTLYNETVACKVTKTERPSNNQLFNRIPRSFYGIQNNPNFHLSDSLLYWLSAEKTIADLTNIYEHKAELSIEMW